MSRTVSPGLIGYGKRTSVAILFLTLAVIALTGIFSSCSKEKTTDISDLLASVPADASSVVAVNLESILTKMECKIEGQKVIPGDKMKQYIAGIDKDNITTINRFFAGDYGLEPSVALVFVEGHDIYLTGSLADPAKFKAETEKNTGGKFASADGVETCANVAVKGTRFWVRTSHNNMINASEIARFTALSDKLSFLSNSYAPQLSELDRDIKGWANIAGIFNAAEMDFSQKAMLRMALGAIFDDASDLSFGADFKEGLLESDIKVLDSKGKPAKFLFPAGRIDVSALAKASGSAQAVTAISISKKMIEKIKEQVGANGISMMKIYAELLSSVDGTCVVLSDPTEGTLSGFITTTGQNTGSLSDALSSMGCEISKDGNLLRFSKGLVKGSVNPADVASEFKGAVAGVVVSGKVSPGLSHLSTCSLMLQPAEGSLILKLSARSDKKENILFSLLP